MVSVDHSKAVGARRRAAGLPALWLLCLALLCGRAEAQIQATIIDHSGERFEVSNLAIGGRNELEVWVDGQRRLMPLAQIRKLRVDGGRRDEEVRVTLTLRTGEELSGTILAATRAVIPHHGATSGGQMSLRLSGGTDLGPFVIDLSQVREVLLQHSGPAAAEPHLKATVVTVDGKRFEVEDLRYRGAAAFDYSQGRMRRSKDMSRMARIEFSDTAANTETRSITIHYRSGKTVQGTVDAGTVRLAGETDRIYDERVNGAFTGKTAIGMLRLGLHQVKLIIFREEDEAPGDSASVGS